MSASSDHESIRKKLWCDAILAYLVNTADPDCATSADNILAEFDKRFGNLKDAQEAVDELVIQPPKDHPSVEQVKSYEEIQLFKENFND